MSRYVRRERFEVCMAADSPGRYRPQRCPHRPRCELTPAGFGRVRVAWTGPVSPDTQADREVKAWQDIGWTAQAVLPTAEVHAEVRQWQHEADHRLGRCSCRKGLAGDPR